MTIFQKLVHRGNAVLREWSTTDGLDENGKKMLAEVNATLLISLCGDDMKNWTPNERQEKVNLLRTAMTSAFQIGRASVSKRIRNPA
jgi:hypothetical protein